MAGIDRRIVGNGIMNRAWNISGARVPGSKTFNAITVKQSWNFGVLDRSLLSGQVHRAIPKQ